MDKFTMVADRPFDETRCEIFAKNRDAPTCAFFFSNISTTVRRFENDSKFVIR